MRNILIGKSALLFIVFTGCTNADDNREQELDTTKAVITVDTGIKTSVPVDDNKSTDSVGDSIPMDTASKASKPVGISTGSVPVTFEGTNRQVLRGKIAGNGPDVIYKLAVGNSKGLSAIISPDIIGCNIRFNQVIFPGGKSDGPFGKELKIELKEKGNYLVHVGHNRMASNLDACDFTIRFILTE